MPLTTFRCYKSGITNLCNIVSYRAPVQEHFFIHVEVTCSKKLHPRINVLATLYHTVTVACIKRWWHLTRISARPMTTDLGVYILAVFIISYEKKIRTTSIRTGIDKETSAEQSAESWRLSFSVQPLCGQHFLQYAMELPKSILCTSTTTSTRTDGRPNRDLSHMPPVSSFYFY